jgi:mono/diheme cytochrome c family protein
MMNCDGCHGAGALGWVGPSLVDGRWRYGGADGEVYQSIFYGRPRGMPAYGGILSSDAIWKIVTYLRGQPIPKNVPTESWITGVPTRPAPAREQTPGKK